MFQRFKNLSCWIDIISSVRLKYKGKILAKKPAFSQSVPSHIILPPYALSGKVPASPLHPERKSNNEIKYMKEACSLAREVLNVARDYAQVGITTKEIDHVVHNATVERGAYPSPLNYNGFPKSVCTSVNEVVCHGVPDEQCMDSVHVVTFPYYFLNIPACQATRPACSQLENGGIINIDVSVYVNGFHGDLSETILIGDVDDDGKRLVSVTRQCLDAAIAVCKHNECFSLIGKTISNLAEKGGFDVIPNFIGHGIGRYFHGPPDILHFDNDHYGKMKSGMTFTIEPILTEGYTDFTILKDGWTCMSCDGSRSAQFEHTILITETGADILTADKTIIEER